MSSAEADALLPGHLPDLHEAVKALMEVSQSLQEDPQNLESVETLVYGLKQHLAQERQRYRYTRQNSENRRKLDSLQNLIEYLEGQIERARKIARRRGVKYYLARVSRTVLGDEMGKIVHSMESELRSWLDQQDVGKLASLLGSESEDAQVKAISTIEAIIRKGYNLQLQETILSCGLVDKLAAFLEPNGAPYRVQREAAFALSAVVDFNRDIFVSQVLMVGLIEKLLALLDCWSSDLSLVAICMITRLISAGKVAITDEIQSHGGVKKLVNLLEHKSQSLQHAAMDCVFEMAYHGRREVVEAMLEQGVVEKLAKLQFSVVEEETEDLPHEIDKLADFEAQEKNASSQDTQQDDGHSSPVQKSSQSHPFSNAIARFALQLGIGTGLRQREKRALKQEVLYRVKEVMPNDTDVANITAEVLWAP